MKIEGITLFTNSDYLLKDIKTIFWRAAKLRNHRHMMSTIRGISSSVGYSQESNEWRAKHLE